MSHEQYPDRPGTAEMPADVFSASSRRSDPETSCRLDGNAGQDEAHPVVSADGSGPLSTRSLVVLLVEDDALIRMDASDMLAEAGHQVIEREYGPDAVAVLQEHSVDVLVTDVGLPGMSGLELAERAMRIQPGIGVVFATGNTELPEADDRPGAIFLCKPYDAQSLAHSVRQAVERR
jgi:CheY-like chemotaxis protein